MTEKDKELKKQQKQEEKSEEKSKYKSDKDTEEPDTTDNQDVTHISPPCNDG